MRVIAGSLGGRPFDSPKGHRTHPMSDKIRGALFNMLGDINGLTFLDAFAGSGALSYEAVSRGAAEVQAIELDKNAQNTIKQNIGKLGLDEKIALFPGSCLRWSARYHNKLFDVVMCDPPYDRVLMNVIKRLSQHVKAQGILALSWPGHLKIESMNGFEQVKAQAYGDAQLVFYRRTLVK
ncbi:MAG TPA: RsmD family RNA methyltransferase [Candidatus Limnocylindrales bacterium]|nr:RsmD family RNA methyltransferase [Candidatus Limnocylindrales bacterium]